jgi:hypothetical protein
MPRGGGGEYDHFKFLKQMQRLELLSLLLTLCLNYRGARYFRYMVDTTNNAEKLKTKFEMHEEISSST